MEKEVEKLEKPEGGEKDCEMLDSDERAAANINLQWLWSPEQNLHITKSFKISSLNNSNIS